MAVCTAHPTVISERDSARHLRCKVLLSISCEISPGNSGFTQGTLMGHCFCELLGALVFTWKYFLSLWFIANGGVKAMSRWGLDQSFIVGNGDHTRLQIFVVGLLSMVLPLPWNIAMYCANMFVIWNYFKIINENISAAACNGCKHGYFLWQ